MNQTVEEALISNKKLTQSQIDQIREIFIMIDEDKSGALSYEEVAKLMSKFTDNAINKEEAMNLIQKMDLNNDGSIEWGEFLQAIYEWLESIGALKDGSFGDGTDTINDRKMFHLKLANFFLQFNQDKNCGRFDELFSQQNENLEEAPESWNFFGTKVYYSQQEKWEIYQQNQKTLENFSNIPQKINSTDYEVVLSAVQEIVKLLNIVSVYKTPGERFEIANHIIRVFDLVENSSCLDRIIECLKKAEEPFLIWECLKAITVFSAGPRIANTPENSNLHPDRFYHKAILVQKDVIPAILNYVGSECIEVKRQAILALGFLCRSCADIRDFVVSLGGASNLLNLVSEKMDIEDAKCISWTLSILSGNTIKNSALLEIDLILDFVKGFTFFLYWKDDVEIITNSLLALSFLIPIVELNLQNQDLWKRIIMMMTHNAIIIKRAAMNCIKKIIVYNDLQGQFLVENGIILLVSELLNYNNVNVKCEACDIISVLANKGHTWSILENTSAITNLARMVYEDPELRWAAIKVFKSLSCVAGEFNKMLLNVGVMKTVFSNLGSYKDYDKVLKEIYGYLEPSYNFTFLIDSLKVLNNLMTTTAGVSDPEQFVKELIHHLEQSNLDRLKNVIESFFNDIEQRRIPLIQLSKDYDNVCLALNEILASYLTVFNSAQASDYTRRMNEVLIMTKSIFFQFGILKWLANFEQQSNKFKEIITSYALFNSSQKLEVRCYSSENFPNGDNRIIEGIQLDISLLQLLLIIEQKYMRSPIVLHYIDDANERITIDDEKALSRAIEKAIFEHQKKNSTGAIALQVIVASPMMKGIRNYVLDSNKSLSFPEKMCKNPLFFICFIYIIDDIFQGSSTNLVNKEPLLEDLKFRTSLDKYELEQIYNSFVQVTTKRFQNKSDGTVNFQEFSQIMKNFVNDPELIVELFNSIDTAKKGQIDFRDFVCALSILKGGTLEDKLRLAFMAYDINHNGFIDKEEMFQLLRASATSKGMILTDNELWEAVNKVFSVVDKNNDGCLSYTEFKAAVLNHHLLINPFWTNPYLLKIFNKKIW